MAVKREKVVKTAEKLVAKGKIEAAIKEYRKVLAENPNDANTLNRVGDLYARIERFDEAVKLFSQIAEQYGRDGFFVKAIAIYKKIIKLSPQSLQVYERLAELYYKQGLLNEARSQFQILGDHYEKRDNATSAIGIYQRMTEIDPDNPSHYLKLAQLYQGQQLADKALRAYRQLADLFLVNGSIDEATQVYLTALDTYSDELGFVRDVVQGLSDEGHREAAEKILARAKSLNPAAEGIGAEVFARQPPEPEAPEPAMPQPAAADAEVSFDVDDAFDLPEIDEPASGTAEPVAAAAVQEEAAAVQEEAAADQEEDDSVFTLDLDSEEPPATQVMPPPDMLEEEDGASGEIEIEIEDESVFGEAAADDDSVLTAREAPEEIDWSADDAAGGVEEAEIDAIEVEGGGEIEIEIEESVAAPEPAAPPPAAMARHEEDLLAEAKVFSKYGLREKAQDRLAELLGIQPRHLGGLGLMARLELEAGRQAEALEHAKQVARIARESRSPEVWNELREELTKAGYALEDEQIVAEPEAQPAEADRFARLLEDLDETATGVTVVPEAEPAEPVVLEQEPAPLGELPAGEPATPDFFEPLDAAPESGEGEATPGEEPVLVDPSLAAGEADDAGDGPPSPTGQEPFAEIEALMQSVTRDAGFEELIPEEARLEDLMPLDAPASEDDAPAEETAEPAAAREGLVSLADELDLGDLDDLDDLDSEVDEPSRAHAGSPAAEAAAAGSPAAGSPAAESAADEDELDETGMSWLDDIATPAAQSPAIGDSIFDEEDDFFDLAAELEAEMAESSDEAGVELEAPQEQNLQDIIDGFKRGVAENLSSEDYDTHYNLGIAYREMGLLDEAIGEFQLASKDPRYIVDCSSMLGICFLEKGLPELAVRWYKKGLESPALDEERALGLLYDLASAYLGQGDAESAFRTYVEIYGMNSNYRDVAQRIQELQEQTTAST